MINLIIAAISYNTKLKLMKTKLIYKIKRLTSMTLLFFERIIYHYNIHSVALNLFVLN